VEKPALTVRRPRPAENGPFPQDKPDIEKSGFISVSEYQQTRRDPGPQKSRRPQGFSGTCKMGRCPYRKQPPSGFAQSSASIMKPARINPRLVVTSITYFGHSRPLPLPDYKGCDLIAITPASKLF